MDLTKYCHFQQEHEHDTKDCFVLKEIEALVHRGYLRTYINRPKDIETSGR